MNANSGVIETAVHGGLTSSDLIALGALLVAFVSVLLSMWTAYLQRRHMRLSVRPVGVIPVADWENRVGVFLKNTGLGPMRIVSLQASDEHGNTSDKLLDLMPALEGETMWTTFHDTVDGATIEPGYEYRLLLLEGDLDDEDFISSRDRARDRLQYLTVTLEYEDLYGVRMEPCVKRLTWFGRHREHRKH